MEVLLGAIAVAAILIAVILHAIARAVDSDGRDDGGDF